MTTITSSSTVGIFLSSPAYTNPVIVNQTVVINVVGYAVEGFTAPWTVQNSGSIAGTGTASCGIFLTDGGAVTNEASGSISGGYIGISIINATGTVTNDGTIAGTGTASFGIILGDGGSVTNAASASITGSGIRGGVFIGTALDSAGTLSYFGAGTLNNYGRIAGTGTSGFGVFLADGGSVTNATSASITGGRYGVKGIGATGTVINDGSIASTNTYGYGVLLDAGGSVTNAASASITGATRGVEIRGATGIVVNNGTVTGTNSTFSQGVYLRAGGSVTNTASASITGTSQGVEIGSVSFSSGGGNTYFGPGTVVNYGTIKGTGTSAAGVLLEDGGTVTNRASGVVLGSADGIDIQGNLGTVVNYGSIAADATFASGVELAAGGSVTNAASGSISAGVAIGGGLVIVAGGAGTVVNRGVILGGGNGSGVELELGGYVTNAASASIMGTSQGIGIGSGTFSLVNGTFVFGGYVGVGTVVNDGSIAGTGTFGIGVSLDDGGSVTNATSASITGVSDGVEVSHAAGIILNNGSIAGTGTSGIGVYLRAGGAVTNAASASITGASDGIAITGAAGTVVNDGTIAGTSGTGVDLRVGGYVTNAASASITGANTGVEIGSGLFSSGHTTYVGPGTVVNDGTIAGTNTFGIGVDLFDGGVVTNAISASITGVRDGIEVSHAAGTVVNDGGIAGTGTNAYGIYMRSGGSVTNAASASITAPIFGIDIEGAIGTVVNDGTITSTGTNRLSRGVELDPGGSVTNAASASITAFYDGISMLGSLGTVVNYGSIAGGDNGVYLNTSGFVTNKASGSITGGGEGVGMTGSRPGTVVNYGTITATRTGGQGAQLNTNGRGVQLNAGGSITNEASGSIIGVYRGAEVTNGVGTIVNYGGITATGTKGFGVETGLTSGAGIVLNHGSIAGNGSSGIGVLLISGGSVANYGSITATGSYGDGVDLKAGGYVTNAASGSITGSSYGVLIHGGVGTVVNAGSIAGTVNSNGTTGRGVQIEGGGSVTNMASGSIIGVFRGAEITDGTGAVVNHGGITATGTGGRGVEIGLYGGAGTVVNYGNIASTGSGGIGVLLEAGGSVTNAVSATITGSTYGVDLSAGGTVSNDGTIIGNNGTAVYFGGTGSNLLVLTPGYDFSGLVVASPSASNTIDLDLNGRLIDLPTLDAHYINFQHIIVQGALHPNNRITFSSPTTIAAGTTFTEADQANILFTDTLVNDGTIVLDPSTMVVAGLTGTGSTEIDAGSTLEVQGTVSGGQTIMFAGSGAYFHLDSPDSANGSVTNFDAGETIDLKGINPASVTYTGGMLSFSGGGFALSLAEPGTITVTTSGDGAAVTLDVPCFLPGTHIRTPRGEVPVERLAVGDTVVTLSGRHRRLCWIGHGRALATRGRRSAATPLIVRKGALAENVPNRDLHITKGHSLFLDGVLIPVEFLVNHRSILWDDVAQEVEVFHLELDAHDILIANGAAAESYRDDGNRWLFRNANSGWDLPPKPPCAPVLTGGPAVDAVWRRLLDRAGKPTRLKLTEDPHLALLLDGMRVAPTVQHDGLAVFILSRRPREARLVSRSAVPLELGLARDARELGVAVRRLAARKGSRPRIIEASDARLTDGFHAFEPDEGIRWTNGDAELPLDLFAGFKGEFELAIHLGGATQYIDDGKSVLAA